ncbi:hypothetical protein HK102_009550 [Quaeritorhiza haematococci]|nr:hypothetical protein HK102_009550 [Quaeritorhiza haematococci]
MAQLEALEQLFQEMHHRFSASHRPLELLICQPDAKAKISLKTYMKHNQIFASQREFIQNWMDQCRSLATSEPVVIHETHTVKDGRVTFFGVVDERLGPGRNALALGYLAELVCEKRKTPLRTYIGNFGTTLTQYMMIIGKSNKRGVDTGSAGYFREGVKVAINRLTADGIIVEYITGWNVWMFGYEDGVLHLHSFPHTSNVPQHTIVRIDLLDQTGKPLPTALQMSPISTTDYLFLYRAVKDLSRCTIRSSGLAEIIADVSEGLAINYLGPTSTYDVIGLGRDRNQLDGKKLFSCISGTLALSNVDNHTKALASYLLRMLRCNSDWSLSFDLTIGSLVAQEFHVAKDLNRTFADRLFYTLGEAEAHGRPFSFNDLFNIFPYTSSEKEDAKQACYLGAHTVEVSACLHRILCESQYKLSLKQLWHRRKEDARREPNFDTSPMQGFVDSLRDIIHMFFDIPGDLGRRRISSMAISSTGKLRIAFNQGEVHSCDVDEMTVPAYACVLNAFKELLVTEIL